MLLEYTQKEYVIVKSLGTCIISHTTLQDAFDHPERRFIIFEEELVCIIIHSTKKGHFNITRMNGVINRCIDGSEPCILVR